MNFFYKETKTIFNFRRRSENNVTLHQNDVLVLSAFRYFFSTFVSKTVVETSNCVRQKYQRIRGRSRPLLEYSL